MPDSADQASGGGEAQHATAIPVRAVARPGLLVPVERIRTAARRLAGVAVRTPLLPYPGSAPHQHPGRRPDPQQPGGDGQPGRLLVKPESLQPTGSFKIRGAYAAISALPARRRAAGVIAHSSGNHAQAVAYAAAVLGCPAVVVVPETAAPRKVAAARGYGAQVVTVAPTLAARVSATEELAGRHGYEVIPPFDDARVIAGQGTIGLEIAADCQRPGAVLVPVGGGGLISGIAAAIKAVSPRTAVVGVEPDVAADARASLRTGERVRWPATETARTVADALRVEQIGELPVGHIRAYVDDIVTVTEDEITAAVRRIADDLRLIAEPAGAVAIAAYLYHRSELPAGDTYVAVLSGGNIDPGLRAGLLGAQ